VQQRGDQVILRVGASADPETRRFPVEIEVPNEDGRLLPGMVTEVTLDLGEPVVRTLVPREATTDAFGMRLAYVVEEGPEGPVARQRRIVVKPVPFHPEQFEVVEGLEPGERIAVTEVRQLRDGERVRPRPVGDEAPAVGSGVGRPSEAAGDADAPPDAEATEPAPTAGGTEPAPTAGGTEPAPTAGGTEPAPAAAERAGGAT